MKFVLLTLFSALSVSISAGAQVRINSLSLINSNTNQAMGLLSGGQYVKVADPAILSIRANASTS